MEKWQRDCVSRVSDFLNAAVAAGAAVYRQHMIQLIRIHRIISKITRNKFLCAMILKGLNHSLKSGHHAAFVAAGARNTNKMVFN